MELEKKHTIEQISNEMEQKIKDFEKIQVEEDNISPPQRDYQIELESDDEQEKKQGQDDDKKEDLEENPFDILKVISHVDEYLQTFKLQSKDGLIIVNIKRQFAQGGFGKIYECEINKNLYALKKVKKTPKQINIDLQREIDLNNKISHQNIVNCYNILQTDNNYYFILDFCDRKDAIDFLRVEYKNLKAEQIYDFMGQVSNVINFVHQNQIIFRDLKFENILVKTNPNYLHGFQYLLTDFGLSKLYNPDEITLFKGTVCYFAPEQLDGANYSFKIDIYSLGILFHFLVTTKFPYDVQNFIANNYPSYNYNFKEIHKHIITNSYSQPQQIKVQKKFLNQAEQLQTLIFNMLLIDQEKRWDSEQVKNYVAHNLATWNPLKI